MSQPHYNTDREAARVRFHPKLNHSRWYVLRMGAAWIEAVAERLCRQFANARVVDLGCGEQPYRQLFEARGMSYHGVDLPGNALADSSFSETGRTEAPDASFDVALSLQVLEHVDDPKGYLDEARRVLRPGGYLVLATPFIWIYHPDPGDYWRWTCEGLKRQITASGFRIVEFDGVVGLAAAGLHLVQDSVLRRVARLSWPIIGRLFRIGEPALVVFFQLLIAIADSLSTNRHRRGDAMGYFVLATTEPSAAATFQVESDSRNQ